MTSPLTLTLLGIAGAIVAVFIITLATELIKGTKEHEPSGSNTSADVSIHAVEGSVVTVRKVGRTTRVEVRHDIHDHWEGNDGIVTAPTPIEITAQDEPELYAEYMDDGTSATRRYEIAEYLYTIGYTVPYIKGLNEQWRREQEQVRQERARAEAGASHPANPVTERTAPTPGADPSDTKGGLVYRKLSANRSLSHEIEPDSETNASGTVADADGGAKPPITI